MPTTFHPSVWGPHYWFFLHTAAMVYPNHPNDITQKRYYELLQNFHLFIPTEEIATSYQRMLDTYPVQPYLTNRTSLMKWMHFIHNRINEQLEKRTLSMEEYLEHYEQLYEVSVSFWERHAHIRQKLAYVCVLSALIGVILWAYRK